jgi:lysophospholipase L1-like esterase
MSDKKYYVFSVVMLVSFWTLFGGLFAPGGLFSVPVATPTPQPHTINSHLIVCVGDPITLGQPNPNNWPYDLGARLGPAWTVINQGVSGDMTSNMLACIGCATSLNPHYVVIEGGTNDLIFAYGMFTNLPTNESNIRAMCDRVVANGGAPVLSTVIPNKYNFAQQQTLNTWIKSYAQSNGYPLIDFYTVMNDPARPGYPNPTLCETTGVAAGVHPNASGYIVMANAIDLSIF